MLSGSPAGEQQCLIVTDGSSKPTLEPCLRAVARGDGRDVWKSDEAGQIQHIASGLVVTRSQLDVQAFPHRSWKFVSCAYFQG